MKKAKKQKRKNRIRNGVKKWSGKEKDKVESATSQRMPPQVAQAFVESQRSMQFFPKTSAMEEFGWYWVHNDTCSQAVSDLNK